MMVNAFLCLVWIIVTVYIVAYVSEKKKTLIMNKATMVLIMNPIYELTLKCKTNKKRLKLVLTTKFYNYPT